MFPLWTIYFIGRLLTKKVVTMGFFDDSLEVSGYLENPEAL